MRNKLNRGSGPLFLWKDSEFWPAQEVKHKIPDADQEVKKEKKVFATMLPTPDVLDTLENRLSSWPKMKRVMLYVLRFVLILKASRKCSTVLRPSYSKVLSVTELETAGANVLRLVQERHFNEDMAALNSSNKRIKSSSKILNLNPFIGEDRLLHVGGRLKASQMEFNTIHPILRSKVTTLIIRWCHTNVAHGGRNSTLNQIQNTGFWVISANSAVRYIIYTCVVCRYLRGKTGNQIMSNLPKDRLECVPPFTHCGVDMFGPFIVKVRRTELKRYGAMFTCFSSRAVHIEVTSSMETNSFILALRRFIARRGNVRTIRSDNGGNFIGANSELQKAFAEMSHTQIAYFLLNLGTDCLIWNNNPPAASHMGGVWERQIRSARTILSAILKTHSASLTDESLCTLMTEVEAILNSRPLTVESLSDVNSLQPLSPNNLLTQKSKVVMPPPGAFTRPDLYCRKQWRRVQHMANEFWSRWRTEFLLSLQERKKWKERKRIFQVGDIVLLKSDVNRCDWPMAIIEKVVPDEFGDVRKVSIRMSNKTGSEPTVLERPITKLVLLVESNLNGRFPDEEPLIDQDAPTP